MTKLSDTILARIKTQHLHPVPRWHFVLRQALVWGLVVLSVVVAATTFGTMLAGLIGAEWALAPRWPGQELGFVFDIVHGLWIGAFVVAVIGAVLFFRLTRRGYRSGLAIVSSVLVLTSIITGALLLPTSLPGHLQDLHNAYFPQTLPVALLNNPAEGRLLGEILEVNDEGDTASFRDATGKLWTLWIFDEQPVPLFEEVRVFGEEIDEGIFAALAVRALPPEDFVQGLLDDPRMPH